MTIGCSVCGTTTGQHGFSFDSRARAYQELQKNRGMIMIPDTIDPPDFDPEKEKQFVAFFMESIKKALEARSDNEVEL